MAFASPAPGDVFAGDYRVVQPLGEGGMGAVYVVEQISTGARRALKLMQPQLVRDESLRKRFEQESKVSANIRSEHVVQVLGAGVDQPSGVPWMAMELLEGEELAKTVARRGPLPPGEVLEILAQLCHAVGAAHEIGVVHRDLKPENVFLSTARREGVRFTVKVLDFGIAKVVAESKAGITAAIGTPMWMAPEQMSVSSSIVPATDVWAIGLIAFYLLTGLPYWRSGNEKEATTEAMYKEVVLDAVVPASQRAAELGRSGLIPPGFDAWFSRCVVRIIAERFPNASVARAGLAAAIPTGVAPQALAPSTQPMQSYGTPPHGPPMPSQPQLAPLAGATPAQSTVAAAPWIPPAHSPSGATPPPGSGPTAQAEWYQAAQSAPSGNAAAGSWNPAAPMPQQPMPQQPVPQ